jgi:CRP-like cAMP-binding protein
MDHTLVHTIPLFAGVKRRRRLELAALADEITVPAGTKLTREGAYANEFFVIVDGQAEVVARRTPPVQTSAGSTRLATLKLATLGPGDFFAEVGLIDGPARSATVVALTPMRLLVASTREFRTLMHSFPGVAERIRAAFILRTGADV